MHAIPLRLSFLQSIRSLGDRILEEVYLAWVGRKGNNYGEEHAILAPILKVNMLMAANYMEEHDILASILTANLLMAAN